MDRSGTWTREYDKEGLESGCAYGMNGYKKRCDSDRPSYRHSPVTNLSPIRRLLNQSENEPKSTVLGWS